MAAPVAARWMCCASLCSVWYEVGFSGAAATLIRTDLIPIFFLFFHAQLCSYTQLAVTSALNLFSPNTKWSLFTIINHCHCHSFIRSSNYFIIAWSSSGTLLYILWWLCVKLQYRWAGWLVIAASAGGGLCASVLWVTPLLWHHVTHGWGWCCMALTSAQFEEKKQKSVVSQPSFWDGACFYWGWNFSSFHLN